MLKVAPWKGVMRFGKRGKLNPRYIGPFRIIERIGPVAYRLELPQELSRVHNVFHICNLKKCLSNDTLVIPLEEIQLDDKLNFVEEPDDILLIQQTLHFPAYDQSYETHNFYVETLAMFSQVIQNDDAISNSLHASSIIFGDLTAKGIASIVTSSSSGMIPYTVNCVDVSLSSPPFRSFSLSCSNSSPDLFDLPLPPSRSEVNTQ
ncbi:hypothetical protein Tco_0667706 [Tanacetum coccineum]